MLAESSPVEKHDYAHRCLSLSLSVSLSLCLPPPPRYETLAVATEAESRQDPDLPPKTGGGKRLTPDWTFVLGETALDLCVPSYSHASSSIFVLGERNLYCLRDNSHIRFMKKLEFNPSCFLPYASVTDGTTNLLLGNHTNMLLVYQDVTLKWAAQLSFVPVAVRVANFPEIKGVVVSLSSDGHLLCSYMGTDPSFFSTPKVDAREADYEQVDAEMKMLQKFIREASRTQDILPKADAEEDLTVTATVSSSMDSPSVHTGFKVFVSGCSRSARVGVLNATMDMTELTRKHGIKIPPTFPVSVELTTALFIFLDTIGNAEVVIDNGIEVGDNFFPVYPLCTPAVKVTVSNVPPFIRDEDITRELSRYRRMVSKVKKVSSGCRSPLLKHVVSHRRRLRLIPNNRSKELNLVFRIRVEDFDYLIYATTDDFKCVGSSTVVAFSAFLNGDYPPADLTGDITVSYSSQTELNPKGVPRVLQSRFRLPLALLCVPSSPAKTTKFKITVDTNQPPVDLNSVFPEFSAKSEDKDRNSLAFHFLSGATVTVLASKTSQRYRIQSDRFQDMWLVVKELVQRFDQHFSKLGVKDFKKSFSGPLPLQEYFLTVDHHFQLRVSARQYQDLLSERAVQFRAIQRRLLTRFKDKTPAPLQNLDTLLDATYSQVMALAEAAEQNRALLEEAFVGLRSATHLLVLLLSLWQGLTPDQTAILEATLLPLLQDTPQLGWEESCDAAVTHLLRSCLSRSPKDQATSLAQQGGPVLGMPHDTARLKKHITLMCDRIGKGGRLTLASEANVPVPVQVQNLAAPGGVEPIAEVAGDGDELELPQEATKFIKKKQPSKKVKKGRSLVFVISSPSLLCVFTRS
ncbi:protein PTHB1-like [Anarrhichthys ocellatus]|uniref:protein PTHB1-like n=1 Tax=Anarrhichthys ocellatus TaxID=433405 RepID=UPI0012ED9701|nr:protein PTHB1-like [Anarrhichthys ocellatus]